MASTSVISVALASRCASGGHSAMVARKNSLHRQAARLEVVGPHDGADAGRAVVQRNEPEPAVLEPIDRDVTCALARVALRTAEVAEHGRAVVPGIAPLGPEPVGQEGVAARGIDQEARLPAPAGGPAALALLHLMRAALRDLASSTAAHAAALDDLRAGARGVADQDLVELRASHVVGVRLRFVPGVREPEVRLSAVPGRDELRAPFLHADGAHLFGHAELFEQRQIRRQQRLADMKARMAVLLEQR